MARWLDGVVGGIVKGVDTVKVESKFFGGKSYEKIVRTLIGYLTGDDFDTEDLLSLFIPPSEPDELADEKYDGDKRRI